MRVYVHIRVYVCVHMTVSLCSCLACTHTPYSMELADANTRMDLALVSVFLPVCASLSLSLALVSVLLPVCASLSFKLSFSPFSLPSLSFCLSLPPSLSPSLSHSSHSLSLLSSFPPSLPRFLATLLPLAHILVSSHMRMRFSALSRIYMFVCIFV